jgi:hypothetical protein
VNEVKGDKSFCQYLRVLVIATRHIYPFDQLVRPSSGAGILSGNVRMTVDLRIQGMDESLVSTMCWVVELVMGIIIVPEQ